MDNFPFFLLFVLSHMLGDFFFQSNFVAKLKTQSPVGLLLHIFLVFLSTTIIFFPFLKDWRVLLVLVVNAIIHYGVDFSKMYIDKTFAPKKTVLMFWIDQMIHILVFAVLVFFLPESPQAFDFVPHIFYRFLQNTEMILYLIGFFWISYMLDIVFFMHKKEETGEAFYSRSYTAMTLRVLLFAVLFLITLFLKHFIF
jgi:hypothetical protein